MHNDSGKADDQESADSTLYVYRRRVWNLQIPDPMLPGRTLLKSEPPGEAYGRLQHGKNSSLLAVKNFLFPFPFHSATIRGSKNGRIRQNGVWEGKCRLRLHPSISDLGFLCSLTTVGSENTEEAEPTHPRLNASKCSTGSHPEITDGNGFTFRSSLG